MRSSALHTHTVIPAKAGTQAAGTDGAVGLGSRFRGNDDVGGGDDVVGRDAVQA
ncbi:MAG: hypothetical protein WBQ75_11490 [Acetobacteraceae bacterium]